MRPHVKFQNFYFPSPTFKLSQMDTPSSTRVHADTTNNEKDDPLVYGSSNVMELSSVERARLLRKLDWHLLPQVTLLYFLSFL